MKKTALLLLVLLGAGIGYSILCSLSAQVVLHSDDALCASAYPIAFRGAGGSPLFLLIVTGFLSVSLFAFIPNGFIYELYKPPQYA